MDKGPHYEVKDMSLAEQGKKNLAFAEMQMGALLKIKPGGHRYREALSRRGVRDLLPLEILKMTPIQIMKVLVLIWLQ